MGRNLFGRLKAVLFALLALAVVFGMGFAEIKFSDPRIPDGELITYDSYLDKEKSLMTEETETAEEGGKKVYIVNSKSKYIDQALKFNRADMSVYDAKITQKSEGVTIELTASLLENKFKLERMKRER